MDSQDELEEVEKRDRGVLTHADREFLAGKKDDLTKQSKRDTRYRIRNRVKESLLDLRPVGKIPNGDRRKIFEKIDEKAEFLIGNGIRFFFRGIHDLERSLEDTIETFEIILEASLMSAIQEIEDNEYIIEVDVNINFERKEPDKERIIKKLATKDETLEELLYLIFEEEFESEENALKTLVRAFDRLTPDEFVTTKGLEILITAEYEDEEMTLSFTPDDFESEKEYVGFISGVIDELSGS